MWWLLHARLVWVLHVRLVWLLHLRLAEAVWWLLHLSAVWASAVWAAGGLVASAVWAAGEARLEWPALACPGLPWLGQVQAGAWWVVAALAALVVLALLACAGCPRRWASQDLGSHGLHQAACAQLGFSVSGTSTSPVLGTAELVAALAPSEAWLEMPSEAWLAPLAANAESRMAVNAEWRMAVNASSRMAGCARTCMGQRLVPNEG